MKYKDGTHVNVGEHVVMDDGIEGDVVCSIDDGLGSEGFSIDDWRYLGSGIVINSKEFGVIHYPTSEKSIITKRSAT